MPELEELNNLIKAQHHVISEARKILQYVEPQYSETLVDALVIYDTLLDKLSRKSHE